MPSFYSSSTRSDSSNRYKMKSPSVSTILASENKKGSGISCSTKTATERQGQNQFDLDFGGNESTETREHWFLTPHADILYTANMVASVRQISSSTSLLSELSCCSSTAVSSVSNSSLSPKDEASLSRGSPEEVTAPSRGTGDEREGNGRKAATRLQQKQEAKLGGYGNSGRSENGPLTSKVSSNRGARTAKVRCALAAAKRNQQRRRASQEADLRKLLEAHNKKAKDKRKKKQQQQRSKMKTGNTKTGTTNGNIRKKTVKKPSQREVEKEKRTLQRENDDLQNLIRAHNKKVPLSHLHGPFSPSFLSSFTPYLICTCTTPPINRRNKSEEKNELKTREPRKPRRPLSNIQTWKVGFDEKGQFESRSPSVIIARYRTKKQRKKKWSGKCVLCLLNITESSAKQRHTSPGNIPSATSGGGRQKTA